MLEPDSPESATGDGHTHERACLNCGTALAGDFCHACGQRAHVHRTIGAWGHDFLHSVLHIDGKFWRTLPMLAVRPGELTRRYARGERARFISPLALFLFTVFAMFVTASLAGGRLAVVDPTGVRTNLEQQRQQAEDRLDMLQQERVVAAASGKSTADIDRRIEGLEREIGILGEVRDRGLVRGTTVTVSDDLPAWIREAVEKAVKNPDLLLYKVKANAYKFSWALIPLSLPFVWLLFLHRRRYRQEFTGYDHLVFVTYSIAFVSLALILASLLGMAGISLQLILPVLFLGLALHIYVQLRGAYGLSRLSALWRTLALLLVAALVLTLFALILLAIGTFG